MDIEQKEGMSGQENSERVKKSLIKEHKFMLLATIMIIMATLFVSFVPRRNDNLGKPKISIITPPLVIITSTPSPEPSQWATSAAILKIEKEILSVQGSINNSDYQDSVLSLPNIDTRVDFLK